MSELGSLGLKGRRSVLEESGVPDTRCQDVQDPAGTCMNMRARPCLPIQSAVPCLPSVGRRAAIMPAAEFSGAIHAGWHASKKSRIRLTKSRSSWHKAVWLE